VDATNIERNLYLTLQLLELRGPMVLALNMMDEVRANGGTIDVQELSHCLGIPVVPISAVKGEGVSELLDQAVHTARTKTLPKVYDFCSEESAVHRCIHAVVHMIQDHADKAGIPARFATTKLIEGDENILQQLQLDQNEKELLEHCIVQMENESGLDRNAALADMRYSFIENVVQICVVKCHESKEHRRSVQMDKVLTGKYTALPVFFGVMLLIFYLTFNLIGQNLSDFLSLGIDKLTLVVDKGLTAYGINPVVHSLITDGVFAGVGSVLSFLPIIVTLFFFLSILEDTGYMARVAFVMDRLLRKIGLSGRSFVPMLIGFGCTVPAIMATRTVSSDRDRKMTILLTPYMSCSAKIPIYAVFSAAFFPDHAALVMIGLYVTGIVLGILLALVLKDTAFRGQPVPFVMELPNYRMPSAKSVGLLLWEKARDFLERAFTVIFLATIIIWFLQTFDAKLNVVTDSADSLLALVGQFISVIFKPLGFNDWRGHGADLRLHGQGGGGIHPGGAAGHQHGEPGSGAGRAIHAAFRPVLPGVHASVYTVYRSGDHHPPGAGLFLENAGRSAAAVLSGLAGGHAGVSGRRLAMSTLDWLLLAAILVGAAVALVHLLRGKKGGCCGDCRSCCGCHKMK
jgi:ferrous iron transport protein B